jgi:hypothetical protein
MSNNLIHLNQHRRPATYRTTSENYAQEIILLLRPEDDGYEDVKEHIKHCLGYAS